MLGRQRARGQPAISVSHHSTTVFLPVFILLASLVTRSSGPATYRQQLRETEVRTQHVPLPLASVWLGLLCLARRPQWGLGGLHKLWPSLGLIPWREKAWDAVTAGPFLSTPPWMCLVWSPVKRAYLLGPSLRIVTRTSWDEQCRHALQDCGPCLVLEWGGGRESSESWEMPGA